MKTKLVVLLAATFAILSTCSKKEVSKPASVKLNVGISDACADTFVVKIDSLYWLEQYVRDASNVYALSVYVSYDPSSIEVQTSDGAIVKKNGGFLGQTGDLTIAFVNEHAGQLVIAYSKQGNQPGSDGDGMLWGIKFKPIKTGLTSFVVDKQTSKMFSPNIVGNALEQLPVNFCDAVASIQRTTMQQAEIYFKIVR